MRRRLREAVVEYLSTMQQVDWGHHVVDLTANCVGFADSARMLSARPRLLESGFVQFVLSKNDVQSTDHRDGSPRAIDGNLVSRHLFLRNSFWVQRLVYLLLETIPVELLHVMVSIGASMFQGVLLYAVFTVTALDLGPSVSGLLQTIFFLVVSFGMLGIAYKALHEKDGLPLASTEADRARNVLPPQPLVASEFAEEHRMPLLLPSSVASSSLSAWSGFVASSVSEHAPRDTIGFRGVHPTEDARNGDNEGDLRDRVAIDITDVPHDDGQIDGNGLSEGAGCLASDEGRLRTQDLRSMSFWSMSSPSTSFASFHPTSSFETLDVEHHQRAQQSPHQDSELSESASLASSFASYSDSHSIM